MDLKSKINKVNDVLDSFGSMAVQEYDTGSFNAIGYKPQYILDAMNDVFGAGNWRHVLHKYEIHEVPSSKGSRQVCVVEVSIQFVENGNVTFETGHHFGGGNVVKGNIADGLKSAVTDAVGKTLSTLSVGFKAYRGTLAKEYKGKADKVLHPYEGIAVPEIQVEDVTQMSSSRFTTKSTFIKPTQSDTKTTVAEVPEESPKPVFTATTPVVETPKAAPPNSMVESAPSFKKPQTTFSKPKFSDFYKETKEKA